VFEGNNKNMGIARFEVSEVKEMQALTGGGANLSRMGISPIKIDEPEISHSGPAVSLQKPSISTPGGP
jgi:hypothetical protein